MRGVPLRRILDRRRPACRAPNYADLIEQILFDMGVSAVITRHNPGFRTGHGVPVKASRMHSRGVVLFIQKARRNHDNLE
jgi:hypothetical protein